MKLKPDDRTNKILLVSKLDNLIGVIPKTFFITGLGRSGTKFLATILGRSVSYRVIHEWHLPPLWRDGKLKKFPVYRFILARYPAQRYRKGYGEVNSHLRRTIDHLRIGHESLVEKRGIILRDPRDIIASVMNRRARTIEDFESTCVRVLQGYDSLVSLLSHPKLLYEKFEFEKFTTDVNYLQSILAWIGIVDFRVTEADLRRKINTNSSLWFPSWYEWNSDMQNVFKSLERRIVCQSKFHIENW